MSYEICDFFVTDSTPVAAPVAGVTVKILSADGKTTYGQTVTTSSGVAAFLLPSGVALQARFYKFQVGFTNPQLFTVASGQTNTFTVTADILTPPVPLDARLCTAFGYFRDVTGAPQANVDVQFIAKFDPVWLDGAAVLKERISVRSDHNGYMQVNLIRNGQYNCTVSGEEDITRYISVPDAPNVNLPDLLFPIVSLVVLDPPGPAYVVPSGGSQLLGFQVYASDGECLQWGRGDVMFSVNDSTVLSYTISPDGLTLVGIAPGTATLTITRSNKSIVHIPDPGITNGVLLVTVT